MSFLKTETTLWLIFLFCIFISPVLPHMVGAPLKEWMGVSNRTFYFLFIKQNKHLFFVWKTFWIIFVHGKREQGTCLSSSTNKSLIPASKLLRCWPWGTALNPGHSFSPLKYTSAMCVKKFFLKILKEKQNNYLIKVDRVLVSSTEIYPLSNHSQKLTWQWAEFETGRWYWSGS